MVNPSVQKLTVVIKRWRTTIKIDCDLVRVWRSPLFSSDTNYWEESISAFDCVAFTRDPIELGAIFFVTLEHPDSSKSIRLGSWAGHHSGELFLLRSVLGPSLVGPDPVEERARKLWREAAHVLDLPAKEQPP